jgi:endo-beta-N-acetylglucosaminidase D
MDLYIDRHDGNGPELAVRDIDWQGARDVIEEEEASRDEVFDWFIKTGDGAKYQLDGPNPQNGRWVKVQ